MVIAIAANGKIAPFTLHDIVMRKITASIIVTYPAYTRIAVLTPRLVQEAVVTTVNT